MNIFLKTFFKNKNEKKFFKFYQNFFSIKEIQNSTALLWVFGSLLFSYFFVFSKWLYSNAITLQTANAKNEICHAYFQSCGKLYFLEALPYGYSQSIFYMILFAIIILVIFLLYKKEYILAHLFTLPLFFWHFSVVFILTEKLTANYEYYLFIFGFTLLFLPYKEFFLKLFLVLFYFLAGSIKIHEGWVLGSYFSSLQTKLPLFPDFLIPLFTNFVIFMELVLVWFLFAKNKIIKNIILFILILFHFYSGILVGYRYPSVVLPVLIILFGLFYKYQKFPIDKKSIFGYFVFLLLIFIHLSSFLIKGDQKLTLEANKYGLYMFEANHQCLWEFKIKLKNSQTINKKGQSESSRNRCDPYRHFFKGKKYCQALDVNSVSMKFDHSINGNAFLRIVDQENICNLEYKAFSKNKWIKTKNDNPEVIGYPVENYYK